MKDLFGAIKHCYLGEGSCRHCPYENDLEKCNKMFENIETVFTKIGEFIEFDDIRNIAQIILKKGEEKNETEN